MIQVIASPLFVLGLEAVLWLALVLLLWKVTSSIAELKRLAAEASRLSAVMRAERTRLEDARAHMEGVIEVYQASQRRPD